MFTFVVVERMGKMTYTIVHNIFKAVLYGRSELSSSPYTFQHRFHFPDPLRVCRKRLMRVIASEKPNHKIPEVAQHALSVRQHELIFLPFNPQLRGRSRTNEKFISLHSPLLDFLDSNSKSLLVKGAFMQPKQHYSN
jgi:hypothetical protein